MAELPHQPGTPPEEDPGGAPPESSPRPQAVAGEEAPAPADSGEANTAHEGKRHAPRPSIWPIVAAVGTGIAVPGFIVNFPLVAQLAMILVGGGIAVASLIGWLLEDRLVLFPGLSRRPAPAPGPPRPYLPPTYALRSEAREAIHHRALQDIARLRFAFPTAKYRYYKTYVNHPQRTMGVQMLDGSVAYPDIVVVQDPENYTKIVAEVETNETVTEDVARYEWLAYADLAPLYLYVPVGKGDEALALCRRLNIPVVGIRTWRYVVGYEQIEINDHYTVASGADGLLPKILRPR